jgi:putative transposase
VIVREAISPDHIHMLLSAPPGLAPAKVVQYIKGRSSRLLQMESRNWGSGTGGNICGRECATVGAVDEATIEEYIEIQKWEDDQEGFKIAVPTKP